MMTCSSHDSDPPVTKASLAGCLAVVMQLAKNQLRDVGWTIPPFDDEKISVTIPTKLLKRHDIDKATLECAFVDDWFRRRLYIQPDHRSSSRLRIMCPIGIGDALSITGC
jgi:hypothetical protein